MSYVFFIDSISFCQLFSVFYSYFHDVCNYVVIFPAIFAYPMITIQQQGIHTAEALGVATWTVW